jgi:hypothetical protein
MKPWIIRRAAIKIFISFSPLRIKPRDKDIGGRIDQLEQDQYPEKTKDALQTIHSLAWNEGTRICQREYSGLLAGVIFGMRGG